MGTGLNEEGVEEGTHGTTSIQLVHQSFVLAHGVALGDVVALPCAVVLQVVVLGAHERRLAALLDVVLGHLKGAEDRKGTALTHVALHPSTFLLLVNNLA